MSLRGLSASKSAPPLRNVYPPCSCPNGGMASVRQDVGCSGCPHAKSGELGGLGGGYKLAWSRLLILVQLCKYSLSLQDPLIAFYLSRSILILFRAFPAFQIPLNHHNDGRRNRCYYPSQAGEARPGAFSPSIAFLISFSPFFPSLYPSSFLNPPPAPRKLPTC
jgi:hypothetical protein